MQQRKKRRERREERGERRERRDIDLAITILWCKIIVEKSTKTAHQLS